MDLRRIHTRFGEEMMYATLTDLSALVEQFAAALHDLNLTGDEQKEYSTILVRLQDQGEKRRAK